MTNILKRTINAYKFGDWNLVVFGLLMLTVEISKVILIPTLLTLMNYTTLWVFNNTDPRQWGGLSTFWIIFFLVTLATDIYIANKALRSIIRNTTPSIDAFAKSITNTKEDFNSLPLSDTRKQKEYLTYELSLEEINFPYTDTKGASSEKYGS